MAGKNARGWNNEKAKGRRTGERQRGRMESKRIIAEEAAESALKLLLRRVEMVTSEGIDGGDGRGNSLATEKKKRRQRTEEGSKAEQRSTNEQCGQQRAPHTAVGKKTPCSTHWQKKSARGERQSTRYLQQKGREKREGRENEQLATAIH